MTDDPNHDGLRELRERFSRLHELKIRSDQALKVAHEQLESLKDQLRLEYQTDDIEELRQILDERRKENQRRREAYSEHLQKIEGALSEIEGKFQPQKSQPQKSQPQKSQPQKSQPNDQDQEADGAGG